jgi:hypothetical protein
MYNRLSVYPISLSRFRGVPPPYRRHIAIPPYRSTRVPRARGAAQRARLSHPPSHGGASLCASMHSAQHASPFGARSRTQKWPTRRRRCPPTSPPSVRHTSAPQQSSSVRWPRGMRPTQRYSTSMIASLWSCSTSKTSSKNSSSSHSCSSSRASSRLSERGPRSSGQPRSSCACRSCAFRS